MWPRTCCGAAAPSPPAIAQLHPTRCESKQGLRWSWWHAERGQSTAVWAGTVPGDRAMEPWSGEWATARHACAIGAAACAASRKSGRCGGQAVSILAFESGHVSQHVRLLYVPPNVFGMQLAVSLWKHSFKSLLYLPSHYAECPSPPLCTQTRAHRRASHSQRGERRAADCCRALERRWISWAVSHVYQSPAASVSPEPRSHTNRSVHPLLRTYRSHAHCAQEGQYPGALQLHTSIVPSITRTSRSLKLAMSCSFWLASCRA